MIDESQNPDFSTIPDAVYQPRRRRRLQLVWIIPIVAALIGASLAIKSYVERGPVITISFPNGEGLEPGKTKIKYKEVQIGEVKGIAIAKDRSHVVVTAELTREAERFLVADTRFWVVRARITGGNVSGLGTLVGGSYIGVDVGTSAVRNSTFKGLDRPPVVTMDVPGRQFVLHAKDIGSLDISSPLFYRRMQVGEIMAYELDKDGSGVTLNVFVRAPFDQYVKPNTTFWQASGIDISLDANGVKVTTESMLTIMLGGISFQTPEDRFDAPPAQANSVFTLFSSKEEALKRPDTVVENYVLVFKESVRGLAVGAPVDLRGVTVGEVSKINLELDPQRKQFSMPVEIQFYPERLQARYRSTSQQRKPVATRELLNSLVEHGFRAQLRSGNLLTGQLYVALDFFPKAATAKMDWSKPVPEFPTIAGSMEQFQASLMQIVNKIDKLPMEELAGDTRQAIKTLDTTLKNTDQLLKNVDAVLVPEARSMLTEIRKSLDDVRSTLAEARKTMGGAQQTLSADAPLQKDLREALREMNRAGQSLRGLADYLERHPESLIWGKKEK
ncbi:MAG: MlaD family protein [Desulfuromonadaceae bacterium]|nr:MlaD family protein [Desulfuromonadaceae bacterium]